MKKLTNFLALWVVAFSLFSCGGAGDQKQPGSAEKSAPVAQTNTSDPMNDKGIGPVQKVVLEEINPTMVSEGQKIYNEKCLACHKPTEKFIGPAPKGILDRRSPEWIMNMILNPEEMLKSDPIAKQLLIEANLAPMANQHLTQEQARNVLEYFRTLK